MQQVKILLAPECYKESTRQKIVDKYIDIGQWNEKQIFKKIIGNIRREFGVNGVSISVIDNKNTVLKYECLLNTGEITRMVSIDAHTILSQDHLLLLDASKDWRTANNPLVSGFPYIKFYCGVQLGTRRNEAIGALAIFDSCSMMSFSNEKIESLKKYSSEIMTILHTPIEELKKIETAPLKVNKDASSTELSLLRQQLGRATSRGPNMTVFEKDGSARPYSQNHSFKFSSYSQQNEAVAELNNAILEIIIKTSNLKKSAAAVAKMLCSTYSIDFLYVLEIRIAESYQIGADYFPLQNKIESSDFKFANKLVKTDQETTYMTRIIGSYGSKSSSLKFENALHSKAFSSEFGIYYKNSKENSTFNNGIIMPFFRHDPKLVRKHQIDSVKPGKSRKIDLYHRSGGYLVGCFNRKLSDNIDSETISRIFSHMSVMRKAYIQS